MAGHQVETEFEKRRGVSDIVVRGNYAQVNVSKIGEPVAAKRLELLDRVASCGVSIDFLKLTPDGLGFSVQQEKVAILREKLAGSEAQVDVLEGRSIVLVHAVNMRDEEGLIAHIVSVAIESGAEIDHLGDMHDSLLIVTDTSSVDLLVSRLRTELIAGAA